MRARDRVFLADLFHAAVAAADPRELLPKHLPTPPKGRLVVIGAGKGAAQMARAFEDLWPGPLSGVVVTRTGFGVPCMRIRVMEAAHPVPDAAGLAAAAALRSAVTGLGPQDLVVALICGGGSALLPAPPNGLTLDDEQALNRALLASGAPISVMNAVRRQVSTLKGGRLAAAAAPAQVVTLVVSDVPGDAPEEVASGPTLPGGPTRAEVRKMVRDWRIALPPGVARFLAGTDCPAPDARDPVFAGHEVRLIASAGQSLEAAARYARARGVPVAILSDAIEGEARDVARMHAALAREIALRDRPFARPVLLLSGGETTVTLRCEDGRGGRNAEFQLALALAAEGLPLAALAADTDGVDGTEANAGAFVDGRSAARMREAGVDPTEALARNDAWGVFDAIGDLFSTGPTGTNVNDFRAILLHAEPSM
ncbi:MAG: glycerate kinase [Pseudomonadota bacterium]